MRLTPFDCEEFKRMAAWLNQRGYDALAYEMETYTICCDVPLKEFDDAKHLYRQWLNNGNSIWPVRT